jgi:hypothetical protein
MKKITVVLTSILITTFISSAFAQRSVRGGSVVESATVVPTAIGANPAGDHSNPTEAKCRNWKDTFFNVSASNAKFCMEKYSIKVQSIE